MGDRSSERRPWIGVHFACCSVYGRAYRWQKERVYRVRCPRCLRQAVVEVDPSASTDGRFLRVF